MKIFEHTIIPFLNFDKILYDSEKIFELKAKKKNNAEKLGNQIKNNKEEIRKFNCRKKLN
jgi:hypothetical protein